MRPQPTAITGEDVIATPGQCLTQDELALLAMMADGQPPSAIEHALGTNTLGLRHLERSLTAKLGARNKVHIITRAFVLNVLAPRALCLLLAVMSMGVTPDGHPQRAPRRARTPATATRSAQKRASTGASNNGHAPATYLHAQA